MESIAPRDFDRVIKKFRMDTRGGNHIHAWLEHDGAVVVRTRRSHGRTATPRVAVRKQLHLSEEQLQLAIKCPLKFEEYLQILRDQGVIAEQAPAEDGDRPSAPSPRPPPPR